MYRAVDFEGSPRVLNYEKLKAFRRVETYSWTDRDTMLYALSVGVGRDPMNETELPFVYEGRNNQRVLPTFPTVLPRMNFMEDWDINFERVLHGESHLQCHVPLPAQGSVNVESTMDEIYDKGPGKGALLCMTSRATFSDTGKPAYTLGTVVFATADGGFGGPSGGPPRRKVPDRKPDRVIRYETVPNQALIYRLNGDRNPLHADPVVAKDFRFPRPIIHGLCSYGITGWVITRDFCNYDHTRLESLAVRFTSPMYPGEPYEFDFWEDGKNLSFRVRAPERGVTGLDDGRCVLR
jgi:acyl dehydratase